MNQVMLAESGSRQEFLRSLSYLELCTVPSLIPSYLELFDIDNLRNIFVLNCQTYLDLHHNYHNHSPHSTQFQHFIRQCSLKPMGEQLMYFLKMICLHCLSHQLPLEQLFLNIDPTTDMHTIALQKIVLTSLHHHEEASVHVDYISALISLVELSTEIHAIRGGHSKAMTFKATGNYGQTLKLRHQQSRKLEDVEQSLAMLVSDQHESYVRFANVGQQLVRKYQFVVQEAIKVDQPEFPSLDMNPQRQQFIDGMVDQEGLGDHIFTQLQLHCQLQERQMFVAQLHFDCLRNIEHLPLEIVAKTYNTISATVHQLFRQYQPSQNQNNANLQEKIASAKANTYCLLHATKALLASRQPIAQLTFLQELQVSLKQLFEFKLPKIQNIWLLLYSIIQGSLNQFILIQKCAAIFDWTIQFYVKNYPIKEVQYVYADYLIVCKNLLGCWNKDKNQLLEAVNDWLKKPYEDEEFRLMFETLPIKMVHSLAISVFKNGRISSNIESQTQLGQPVNGLVQMNRQVIKECMQLLRKGNKQQMQEEQQQVKKNQHWQVVINVWLQRCSKEEIKTSLQALLWARTIQLINNFNSPLPLPHKISMIPLLAVHCLHECTNLVVSVVNFIQLQFVQSNKKNAAAVKIVEENNQLKLKLQFLSKIQHLMTFLTCLIFSINPAHYTQYLLHAFVINGYLQDMPFETTINQLYNSSLKNIRNNQLLTPSNYEPILTYTPIYDTLQSFYDLVLTRPHVSQQILTHFEKFCKNWCGQQDNYQWISQLKTIKIKLMRFKNYCLTHHSR